METISLGDIDIHDIGTTYQIAGAVWAGLDDCLIALLPYQEEAMERVKLLPMDLSEWERFLRQTDIVETEVVLTDPSGKLIKAILRKTQRNIDAWMQWSVFKRDNYTCRYCGRDGIPLTVDHIVLWERGGPTIPENLLTSCKKCNKDRGSMEYADWLASSYYKTRSKNLLVTVEEKNREVLDHIPELWVKRVTNIRSR